MKKWNFIDEATLEYLGNLEFEINNEWHDFEIMHNENYIVFGSFTNNSFLQSGNMLKDKFFSIDENLRELLEELECYYSDGIHYCNKITTNERM